MRGILLSLIVILPAVALLGQEGTPPRWTPGLRAGVAMIPYERSVPSVASGAFLGAQLTYARPEGTRLSWTADFGRVGNLQINQQFTFTGLLANERVKVTEFNNFAGYTYVRLGADIQPGILRTGNLGLGLFLGAEGLLRLDGGFRRTVYSVTFDQEVTETSTDGSTSAGAREGSLDEPLSSADVQRLVLTGGPQLNYQFKDGPQFSLAMLFDLSGRLVDFDAAAPRLAFLQASFNYPLF